jgi:putative copper export protein
VGDVTRSVVAARAWRAISAGAVLLAVAAVLRLWLQSIELHGGDRAWSSPLLSIMLRDTAWGRAWLLQAAFFALLGMAIVWARPLRDRAATIVAVPAALGLAAIPGLSGHAAGADLPARLALVNDTAHVVSAGAWLGMLAVLIVLAIPAIVRLEADGHAAAAAAIDRFSPLAMVAAALVALTGVVNALLHFTALSQLWDTAYGRVLLVKLLFVAAVALAGFLNWRWIRPRLRETGGARRLTLSAGAELTFALLVIAATAVLTGLPRP